MGRQTVADIKPVRLNEGTGEPRGNLPKHAENMQNLRTEPGVGTELTALEARHRGAIEAWNTVRLDEI